jgi:microcystin-dependent protein
MDPYLAQVILFAGNFAPQDWAYCDGSLIPIQMNTALFSLLGTTYGGNGTTTFALPDLRGRIAIGAGQGRGLSYHSLGEAAGSETHTIMGNQLPAHTHSVVIPTSEQQATIDEPNGQVLAISNDSIYAPAAGAASRYGGVSVAVTGGSQPVQMLQPYLVLNYIIATVGVYPSRS